jgi:putative membrane protein insertion efficiency factor
MFLSVASQCFSEDNLFVPWDFAGTHQHERNERSNRSAEGDNLSMASSISIKGIQFFIGYISKVDGDRCPMYPTCSSYGIEAIKKHGVLAGIVMTVDRLIHENNEMDYAPVIKVGDSYRYYDPLCDNDCWWFKEAR